MLDESVWNDFGNSNQSQITIGGPTIEMLCSSYNKIHNTNQIDYVATGENGYKIKINDGTANTQLLGLSTTEQNKLYVGNNTKANAMWIATPADVTDGNSLYVISSSGIIYQQSCMNIQSCNYVVGFRPVIILKNNVNVKILND